MTDGRYIEQRLIGAALAGDSRGVRPLTEPWIPELRAHCARILGNPYDAEDAVQETLIKAWRKLGSYSASGAIRAWLYTNATNTSLNLLRGLRRGGVADAAAAPPGPGPDARIEAHEDAELVFMSVVAGLPARQRAAIILRDGLGWSALEIAELLGASMASVNSALLRARAAVAPPGDTEPPRLDDLHQALLGAYVAAWDQTDIDGLVALARADATRTTLIQGLRPVGGGWVRLPEAAVFEQGDIAFHPAFMNP